jgi:very-short-patch-repair endonuclease
MLVMPNGILRIEFDVDSIGVCSATFQAKIACGDDLDRQLRVDFLVSSPRASLVVEVDGHQWHERTQEQAIRDRKRDRDLVSVGQIPIRFMAIEVMRNPDSCVNEAISTLSLLHLYAVDQERAWART